MPPTLDELRAKGVRELKDMLRDFGYDPNLVSGIDKAELVEKVFLLSQNPPEEDDYPLPLYSNCWPQFILRGLLLAGIQLFVLSFVLSLLYNALAFAALAGALVARNARIRREKAAKRRKGL
mmetsp:Transcript_63697/g.179299  ORF Transcript_63697/g.179299 Transcript_63697/m.179299 type:complete len:122 (+) Transcript_63697:115-480(+)